MADIGAIVTGLSSAISIGKTLRDTDKAWEIAEFKIKMTELIDKLVDAKADLQTNREENLFLREQIIELKQKISLTSDMVFEDNLYWELKEGGEKVGPYCPKCKDGDSKRSRLHFFEHAWHGEMVTCPVCKFDHYLNRKNKRSNQS